MLAGRKVNVGLGRSRVTSKAVGGGAKAEANKSSETGGIFGRKKGCLTYRNNGRGTA